MFAPTNTASMKTPSDQTEGLHMSNDSTYTSTPQKGRGAKTETQAAAPASAAPGPFWHAPTIKARNALSTILTAASQQDGLDDDDDSSDAIRLIRVALDVVDERFWIDDALPLHQRQNRVASHAFDVLALITGALHYPGQPFVFERRALLGHALVICSALAEMHMDGTRGESLVPQLLESIKVQPQPNHIPPVNAGKARDVAAGPERYTPEQLKSVLEVIAGRMRTLDLMLMQLCENCYDTAPRVEMATAVDCAQLIANGIGAMADEATGGSVFGDSKWWTFGPSFAEAGKAVQA